VKNKRILWLAVLASVSFFVLFLFWREGPTPQSRPSIQGTSQELVVEKKTAIPKMVNERSLETPVSVPPDLDPKPETQMLTAHEEFMRELEMLGAENRIASAKCSANIKEKLQDKEFIDPRSDFYRDVDKLEELALDTIFTMGDPGPSEEMSWLIESHVEEHTPLNINELIQVHHDLQETCLVSSGITLMQTLIEACSYQCPPRLKSLIGNVVFDGLRLLMGNYNGVERIMLALSVMEKSNSLGPYYISFSKEIEDLRFRAQRNYELFQEEVQQYEDKPERLSQAFRSYIDENQFLKDEITNLLKNSAKRYFP
jgi:hypothetical protein